jgi:hypothetical protein
MNLSGSVERGLGIGVVTRVTLAVLTLAATPSRAQSQSSSSSVPGPTNRSASVEVPVAPIECWWKTDRSAVRVGEQFLLTLTCAVLDTERVKVVVDESALDPAALHLVPFDIVGGQRFRDVQNAPRRFFQYQYTMRVLGEEFFGKEVTLPRLQISYRVQNSLQGGAALQGREAQYSLVPVPIRVLSMVPAGANDIRDTPADTFGDVETRLVWSNLLLIAASVAFVLAGLAVIMMIARTAVQRRAATATRIRTVSPVAVLRAASRELAAIRSASQSEGWTGELAGRAAAAARLAGAVALSRPVTQKDVARDASPSEGQVAGASLLPALRGTRMVLSAAVTPESVAMNGRRSEIWPPLSQALRAFTAARYSRNGIDGTALDSALADVQDAVKKLRLKQWLRLGRVRHSREAEPARQSWAR